jgi:hypothetical protein
MRHKRHCPYYATLAAIDIVTVDIVTVDIVAVDIVAVDIVAVDIAPPHHLMWHKTFQNLLGFSKVHFVTNARLLVAKNQNFPKSPRILKTASFAEFKISPG